MTEEFDIQCESCGTIYSTLEDVCPYCGQPQPLYEEYDEGPPYEDQAAPDYTRYPSPVTRFSNVTEEFPDDESAGYEDSDTDDEVYPEYVTYDEGYEEQAPFYDRYSGQAWRE
jgi:hypothetical protein